jgi:hypothetical protein
MSGGKGLPSSAVLSLAMLKVNWDVRRHDYVEAFVPMAVECIRNSKSEVVSTAELQANLKSDFGLSFPQHAVKVLLIRALKRGFVRKENRVFRRVPERLEGSQFTVERDRLLEDHESLLRALCRHSATLGITVTLQEAEQALEGYLGSSQFILSGRMEAGSVLPRGPAATRRMKYAVASFVQRLASEQSEEFAYLERVFRAILISNAMFLPEPANVVRMFRSTKVFVDCPLLMSALGFHGPERKAPCSELLSLLRETGAFVRCFAHTVEEIKGVLSYCSGQVERGFAAQEGYSPSLQHFLLSGCSASDIELLSATLEQSIEELGVEVEPSPTYAGLEQHVVDELALRNALVGQVQYRRDVTVDRDVKSVASVMLLRRGRRYSSVEDCRAVLVTSNTSLARAAGRFFGDEQVGPAICDFTLTNLLWIKSPMAAPNLPRRTILANSFAAMQPNDHLWQRFTAELKTLSDRGDISTGEYYLLRTSLHTKKLLMDLTNGEEEAFTEGTVEQILEYEKAAIRRVTEDQRDRALERVRELERERDEHSLKLLGHARRVSRVIGTVVRVTVILALLLGAVYSLIGPARENALVRLICLCSGLLAVLGAASIWRGGTLRADVERFESYLCSAFHGVLMRFFGPPPVASGYVGAVENGPSNFDKTNAPSAT